MPVVIVERAPASGLVRLRLSLPIVVVLEDEEEGEGEGGSVSPNSDIDCLVQARFCRLASDSSMSQLVMNPSLPLPSPLVLIGWKEVG